MSERNQSVSVTGGVSRSLAIVVLRVALVAVLVGLGWFIYKQLPDYSNNVSHSDITAVQIVLRNMPDVGATSLDVPVDIYPVDIVAVRHEFFTEPRAGKRFEDFLKERMKGRAPVNAKLDRQGHGAVSLTRGNWWLHAKLSGDEEVEWRLPLIITGDKQTIELTPQNAYTRSKSF
jgi:hypothetical protein